MPATRRRGFAAPMRLALGAALALALASAHGRHPDLELDALSDAQIDAMLQAELDDADLAACGLGNPRAALSVDDMFQVVMCALGDAGDDDSEDDLDIDDLEAEMAEAGQRLDNVVYAALVRADALAQAPAARGADDAVARPLADVSATPTPAADLPAPTAAEAVRLALKNGFIDPGKAAVTPVKQGVRFVIRSR